MNWFLLPTLVLAYTLFVVGAWAWKRSESVGARVLLLGSAVLLAGVGLLIPAYYLHVLDVAWYYEFRSWPGTELTSAGVGLLAGIVVEWFGKYKTIPRLFVLVALAFWIAGPHLKPILAPVSQGGEFRNLWSDGVCLQSTGSSCGLASSATLLKASGISTTEEEIAKECHTYAGGTENWYLARLFRRHGFKVTYFSQPLPVETIPVPSIAGIKTGGLGHFIPIIAETETSYITGDPLVGRKEYTKDEIRRQIEFTGFFMQVRKPTALGVGQE